MLFNAVDLEVERQRRERDESGVEKAGIASIPTAFFTFISFSSPLSSLSLLFLSTLIPSDLSPVKALGSEFNVYLPTAAMAKVVLRCSPFFFFIVIVENDQWLTGMYHSMLADDCGM